MRKDAVAVSMVLVLMAVAVSPGIGYCIESSITSCDNIISISSQGISIPSGNHFAEPKTEVFPIMSTPNTNVDSIIEISNGSSDGCFSSGEGKKETICLTQDVSFKIFAASESPSVWINGVKYTPAITGGYLVQESKDSGTLTRSLDEGTVFGGTKGMEITIESEGEASSDYGSKVYIYFVMFSENMTTDT